MHWVSAGRTHVGKVRKLNEDALLVAPGKGLWAVADGMGGHDAGDYASARVVGVLQEIGGGLPLETLEGEARKALTRINEQLIAEGQRRGVRIIGSTLVLLLSRGSQATVMWAGDSRLYRLRSRRLKQLTRDHSRVQELLASGELTPELAERHPEANVITRAIGVSTTLAVEKTHFRVRDGDTFMLCSDGLTRYVGDTRIAEALAHPSCEQACERLIGEALKSPARDNVSVVVMRATSSDAAPPTRVNPHFGGHQDTSAETDEAPTLHDPAKR